MAVEAFIMEIVTPHLENLERRSHIDKWEGSTFQIVKEAPKTPQGDFGEFVTRDLVINISKNLAERINGGKGDFDILIEKSLEMEHKLATEDSNGVFQFNNIKKDAIYDYVFTLGVSPEDLWFNVWTREYMKSNLTTHMSKNGGDSYKFTASKESTHIRPLFKLTRKNFIREVSSIV